MPLQPQQNPASTRPRLGGSGADLQPDRAAVYITPAMKRILPFAVLTLTALLFTGCVAAIGNRDNQSAARNNITLGQQLIDLQRARDVGALTPAEYEVQRARLLGSK